MSGEPLRVSVVDDDSILLDNVRCLIENTSGFVCERTYPNLDHALALIHSDRSQVLLLDVDLPGTKGPAGVRELKEARPDLEIVMFTVYADEDKVFESLCNGASGYLLKSTPPERLLEAIREAHGGGAPMSSEIARKVISLFRTVAPPARAEHNLTPQEVNLLRVLSEGHTYQATAALLDVSINTVRTHVRSVYDKLHVHSRSQAVHRALKRGIL